MAKWHGTQNRKTNEKNNENKHVQNPATKVTIKLFNGKEKKKQQQWNVLSILMLTEWFHKCAFVCNRLHWCNSFWSLSVQCSNVESRKRKKKKRIPKKMFRSIWNTLFKLSFNSTCVERKRKSKQEKSEWRKRQRWCRVFGCRLV